MGLKKWLIKKLVGSSIKSVGNDKSSLVADEYLKQMTSKHARTMRDAEKINKAKLLDMQESQLRRELREGLDDDDNDDYEEEPEAAAPKLEDMLGQVFMQKFLGGVSLPGKPEDSLTSPPVVPGLEGIDLEKATSNLTPEQKKLIAEKFL